MNLPFFYINDPDVSSPVLQLDEETSKHIIAVLRMKPGEKIMLTDGQGKRMIAEIIDDHKKKCGVSVFETQRDEAPARKICVAISLIKNSSRFEWFLEKATEIGISEIWPLICERTEKQKFRHDRMNNICISAMLQSQQTWLPVLHEPIKFEELLLNISSGNTGTYSQKFIAHCIEDEKRNLSDLVNESLPSQIILIGPEGDFSKTEIDLAIKNHFDAVALGSTRLRTETAGVVAAALIKNI